MSEPADYVRMSNAIERNSLVLKVFYQSAFEIVIDLILQKNIQRLDDNCVMRRARRGKYVAGNEDLGVTSAPEMIEHIVPLIQPAII
jgi:hypothetical protein